MGLPYSQKQRRRLYLLWIINKKPEQVNFAWARTNMNLKKSYNFLHGNKSTLYKKITKFLYQKPANHKLKNWPEWQKNVDFTNQLNDIINRSMLYNDFNILLSKINLNELEIKEKLRLVTMIVTYEIMNQKLSIPQFFDNAQLIKFSSLTKTDNQFQN